MECAEHNQEFGGIFVHLTIKQADQLRIAVLHPLHLYRGQGRAEYLGNFAWPKTDKTAHTSRLWTTSWIQDTYNEPESIFKKNIESPSKTPEKLFNVFDSSLAGDTTDINASTAVISTSTRRHRSGSKWINKIWSFFKTFKRLLRQHLIHF